MSARNSNKKWMIIMPVVLAVVLTLGLWLGKRMAGVSGDQYFIYPPTDKISSMLDYIEERYVDPVSRYDLVEEAIPQILRNLDPHSIYIPVEEMQAMNEPLEGNFDGIGVQFNIQNDTIVVISTITGGPSEFQGILPGDRIVTIDDTIYVGPKITSEGVMKKLRGKEGSIVTVGICRRGSPDIMVFEITRGKIPLYSLDVAYMIDETIGYIKISNFSRTTHREFLQAAEKLKRKGMQKAILDLRGNGGGYMDAAVNIADEFIDGKKLIVYTEGRAQPRSSSYSNPGGVCVNIGVVIMIDEWSASASEILAGAIQDNDRGTIIGRRSFGKGLVQEPTEFYDGSGLRLTIARYYTPTGRCIQRPYNENVEDYYGDIGNRFVHGEFSVRDSIQLPDSLRYTTPGGKAVYGGGGIMPDVFVPVDTSGYSVYLTKITNKGLIYKFAFEYVDTHRTEMSGLKNVEQILQFLAGQDVFGLFITYAALRGVHGNRTEINISRKIIDTQLKAFIARNLLDNEGYFPVIADIDATLQKAKVILHSH
ncbi:MAG: S41 family peptidase [Bacteroidetes bacterium]|nr:S41 family peptidase [Bacteroidota bacterium]